MRISMLVLLFWSLVSLVCAHEKGVTDTHIELGFSDVSILFTLPNSEEIRILESGVNSPQALTSMVEEAFSVKNDLDSCQLASFKQHSLNGIDSAQYAYRFACSQQLNEVLIAYTLLEKLSPEIAADHKNYTRQSLLGGHESFVFERDYARHRVSVTKILDSRIEASEQKRVADENVSSFWGAVSYFEVGFLHILEGYDHILFLLGILLLPFSIKQIFIICTSFTLAHSITLAISVVQDVQITPWIIESAIAFSIIYVAIENLYFWKKGGENQKLDRAISLSLHRLAVIFLFGLIHGFGFSYLLKEIGFADQLFSALLFFNLGVEAGQLVIVGLVVPLVMLAFWKGKGRAFSKVGSLLIASMGSFWLVERLL